MGVGVSRNGLPSGHQLPRQIPVSHGVSVLGDTVDSWPELNGDAIVLDSVTSVAQCIEYLCVVVVRGVVGGGGLDGDGGT